MGVIIEKFGVELMIKSTFMHIRTLSELIRVRMGLLVGIAAIGAVNAGGINLPSQYIPLIFIMFFALSSGGFAINDYFDFKYDRITHPKRPIPSGRISRQTALMTAVILFLIAFLSSLFMNYRVVLLTITDILLLYLYSAHIKGSMKFLGNFITGFLCASIFLNAWALGAPILRVLIPSIMVFLFIVAREIILDIRDVRGDALFGLKTFPAIFGERKAFTISAVFFGAFIAFSPFPFIFKIYGTGYLIAISLINVILILALWPLIKNPSSSQIQQSITLTRICLVIGTVAMLTSLL